LCCAVVELALDFLATVATEEEGDIAQLELVVQIVQEAAVPSALLHSKTTLLLLASLLLLLVLLAALLTLLTLLSLLLLGGYNG